MKLNIKKTKLVEIGKVEIPAVFFRRIVSGITKMDVLFGGSGMPGLLPGSTFTLTAPGGCGKTTLMLQFMNELVKQGFKCAIVSGEESIFQLALNAKRLNVTDLKVANMTDIDEVANLAEDYDMVVIDSFQAMQINEKKNGKMNSRKAESYKLQTIIDAGKKHECVFGFIMHHTKSGQMKGSTEIIHAVDANFGISVVEDQTEMRCIYTDGKNRFGPPGEFSAAFQTSGYDFTIDAVETSAEEKKRMGSAPGGKGARRASEIDSLLKAGEAKGSLTLKDASDIIGDMQRARFLMSDLHMSGMFKKTSRGSKAVFEFVKQEPKPEATTTPSEPNEPEVEESGSEADSAS